MSDALAVAVCHHFQDNLLLGNQGKVLKGWDEFVKKNPSRNQTLQIIFFAYMCRL